MSAFGKFIDTKTIEKKVDQLVSEISNKVGPIAGTEVDFVRTIQETPPNQLALDVFNTAKAVREEYDRFLNDITKQYQSDIVFDAFFSSARTQFTTPLDGPYKSNPVPPDNIQKIVERDVYRRQKDPRIILIKDAYRARAQVAVIEHSYQSSYLPIINQNTGFFEQVSTSQLLSLMLYKDQNIIRHLQTFLSDINSFKNFSLGDGFFDSIGDFSTKYPDFIRKFSNQANYLITTEIDSLFDQFKLLENSLDSVIGQISMLSYAKNTNSQNLGVLFGFTQGMLDRTEDMETSNNILTPDPHIYQFRRMLDNALFRSLTKIESEISRTDQQFYQSTEARTLIFDNLKQNVNAKLFVQAVDVLGQLERNLSSLKDPQVLFETVKNTLRIKSSDFEKFPPIDPSMKALQAAQMLKNWSLKF